MTFLTRYRLLVALSILIILIILAVLMTTRIDRMMDYHHDNNDFFTFWLAGHLVTQGNSPYNADQWLASYYEFEIESIPRNPIFLYPLPLALIMAPFGLLPFHSAYFLWVTLTQLMIIASLAILLRLDAGPRVKLFIIPLIAGIILFRPTILTLIQGQISGLFLLVLVWVAYLFYKGKWFWGGFLLGFIILRLNLGAIIIILVAGWLLLQRRWKGLLGIVASGIFMLTAGLLYYPGWVGQYWQIATHKFAENYGGFPTIWEVGMLIGNDHTEVALIIGGLATLLILFGFLRAIIRARTTLSPVSVIAMAVSISLIITPYNWTYDQILLILPITAVILAMDRMGVHFAWTAVVFLIIDALFVLLLFFDTMLEAETLNVIIPALVFCLCLWWLPRRVPAKIEEPLTGS
jgi:hypothetical protein